jgi:hypothetical protein
MNLEPKEIWINELSRELKVKAKTVIDYLPEIGVIEKKTHSSRISLVTAEEVRKHFRELAGATVEPKIAMKTARTRVSELAGELRCKAREILAVLPGLSISRPNIITHNTRIEAEEAEKVRRHFAANPNLREPRVDSVTLGRAKSIANSFGEEI